METVASALDAKALQRTWTAFDRIARLRPIRTDAEYDRTVALMNQLLDIVGDSDVHPLSGLLDLVGELVGDFDDQHHAIEPSEPKEVLRFLMENRAVKQSDLSAIIAQGNLSAILSGRRKISATLAGKLGKYFKVSPAIFIQG
jgi:HTH-type transcriptional regulator / antitoxin HigA